MYRYFILFSLLLFQPKLWSQKVQFEHLKVPLSHNTVYDITKDEDGLMWFATREGLNSYDSHYLKTYYSTNEKDSTGNSLTSSEISCLLPVKTGLYVGTSKGLNHYIKESDSFESIKLSTSESPFINLLYKNNVGSVFVGTTRGLYIIDQNNIATKLINNGNIRSICNYKTNVYWLIKNNTLLLINNVGETVKIFNPNTIDAENENSFLQTIFKDSNGTTWLGTTSGLFFFNESKESFISVPLSFNSTIESKVIRKIAEDGDKNLWLGTELGIYTYNLKTKSISHHRQSFNKSLNLLSDKSIYSLYFDDEGIMWVGTYFGGINYTKPQGIGFQKLLPGQRTISGKAISDIIQDSTGRIWIGTEDSGITIFDKKNFSFGYLRDLDGLNSNNIHSLLQDSNHNIWIGTFLGGLNKYNTKTETITNYTNIKGDSTSISNNFVYALLEDRNQNLWIGTQNGLNIYNPGKNTFSRFKANTFTNKFVYDLIEDHKNNIWICTRYNGIFKYNTLKDTLQHYTFDATNQFVSAYQDKKSNIWFGSLEGGVLKYNYENEVFAFITQKDGLPNNNVYGAIEDKNGIMWLTSNKGLSRYNDNTGEIMNFNGNNGLSTNQFNFKSLFQDTDGWLYFGSTYGLNYFHPDSLNIHVKSPKIMFTDFKLFNKEIPVSDNGILKQNIDRTKEITLDYSQNVMTIGFTSLNYQSNISTNFEYLLEGFETNWNRVGNQRSATYTNLSPGQYTFKVRTYPVAKGSNEKQIVLNINPPFWQSNWAILIYFILLISAVIAYSKFIKFVHKQKLAVQLQIVEKEKIKEVNLHKLNFFTFITHELKTPLTIILASIENYFQQRISPNPPEELISIKKNARKLHQLIMQLMEFRKTETSHAKLELKNGDIMLFLKDTFNAFIPLFENKSIEHEFKHNFRQYKCYFDPNKLEMIFTNILSNAIKYTDENGKVQVHIEIANKLDLQQRAILKITVKDSGKGMTDKEIENVFTPFYKAKKQDFGTEGSGLGLALVKSLVTFLEGSIAVKSNNGSEFIVQIPLILKNHSKETIEKINGNRNIDIKPDLLLNNEQFVYSEDIQGPIKELSLLIVEDNKELIKFLSKHFSNKFKVISAKDGLDALSKLERYYPDLIISDIKMPNMNGIVLCKKVKSNTSTAHIPFILLTARTEETQKIEGLSVGADAYISKPFNLNELDFLVNNLLSSNKSFKSRFSNLNFGNQQDIPTNNSDIEFIKKITTLVESNYQDPSFNIQNLAKKAGISRSLLHIKMKKIMKTNASDFIKKVRLNKAIELMNQGKQISEVAFKVGYNDPNYFSRVFKKEYSVSPTNYLESKENHLTEN
ncbi:hybrid sensor histidine kinase/response regulator transcription factor [Seonamhaeicola sp.]|uniref:hybrid sensor histidine kinase/response regulator transcription factor n=1 Tax=Seonamhaeicola sp. TaxID=1912245 RepID=UPI002602A9A8|nr:hybrid sensor histidine kinase/response regulator transcription factor [Seonamhaeicola sp.]